MSRPLKCPNPLCILDMPDPSACDDCTYVPQPHPLWGGKRTGTGAPVGNLNRLKNGGRSKLIKRGVEKLASDPDLRAVLYLISRLAVNGEVPASTRRLITKIIERR